MQTALFQYAKYGFANDSVQLAATRWDSAKLVLLTAMPPFSPNPLASEFIETDFDGYAAKTIASGTYDFRPGTDGQIGIRTAPQIFICTADNDSDPVIGYALMNSAKDNVLFAATFDAPVYFNAENASLILVARFNMPTIMDPDNLPVIP